MISTLLPGTHSGPDRSTIMEADNNTNDIVLRVKSSSNAASLASAISHGVYENKNVYLRAIGAGAVNQSVKALAIAQGFVGSRGISLLFRPGFSTVTMDDGDITAILFRVFTQ